MAVPTVVGVAAVAGGSGAGPFVPPIPAGTIADDIMVLPLECNAGEVYNVPAGWAHVTGSPVIAADTRLAVMWRRFVAGDVAPSISGPIDHTVMRMLSVRGCKTSGNPWNGTPGTEVEVAGTALATWPGMTTDVADCLILELVATGRDSASTAWLGALTNAAYTNIVEQIDNWVAGGAGGGIGCVSATKASAGATGSSQATLGGTEAKSLMTLALEPPGGAPPPPPPPAGAEARLLLGV